MKDDGKDAAWAAKAFEFRNTDRGFARAEFEDRYGAKCSIQKSSIATEDCLWLGCDHEVFDHNKTPCGARMHLTQDMAAALIPLLKHFVKTGDLPTAHQRRPQSRRPKSLPTVEQ